MSDPEPESPPAYVSRHADIFETAADETRLWILVNMVIRQNESGPLTYSEIMDATGIEDSGRFNYHLDRLRDAFVTVEDDKYVPTMAAHALVGLVYTGKLADDATLGPASVGASCQRCGAPLVAEYDYGFMVACSGCGEHRLLGRIGPRVATEVSLRTLAHRADEQFRAHCRARIESSCLDCGGQIEISFTDVRERFYGRELVDVFLTVWCQTCYDSFVFLTVGQYLLAHPTVQRYCSDHGIDLAAKPSWEYTWTRTDDSTEIRSRDPWEVVKYASVDGCKLVAVVEGDGSVSHVDHLELPERDT